MLSTLQSHLEIITAQASKHFSFLLLAYSLFISPFPISASFSLLYTDYKGFITVLFCHNDVITFYRTTLLINKKPYWEIMKQETLDLGFVSCMHLSSQQRKKKEKDTFHCYPSTKPTGEAPSAGQTPASTVCTSQDSSDWLTDLLWQAIWPCVIKMDKSVRQMKHAKLKST